MLAAVALFFAATGCGNDGGQSGSQDMALCRPEARTCTAADVCDAPCPPDKSPCTDHSCFEPYTCICNGDRLYCRAGVTFCDVDMARPATD